MSETVLQIQSHKGKYPVAIGSPFAGLEKGLKNGEHLIIDANVARLYSEVLSAALASPSVMRIEAIEENKSLEKMSGYVLQLIGQGIKRGDVLVAVGGGIIEDIVAFLAAVLFRGVPWRFYPTTLLAQADSCIGSKSSVNVGGYKNQVGTFTPPQQIHIATEVLETLSPADFRSGIGEIIKVHLIAGWEDFRRIAKNYDSLAKDKGILRAAILRSLEIKKQFIESDEFDRNERLLLNYGHSFGHAIESATHYQIPHGIAITIGIDMANFISRELGFLRTEEYEEIRPLLRKNYRDFETAAIPFDSFLSALSKDKKNREKKVLLLLTKGAGAVFRYEQNNDAEFQGLCRKYFQIFKECR